MFAQLVSSPYFIAAILLCVVGVILTIYGVVALIRARVGTFTLQTLLGIVFISLGLLTGTVAFGIQGYHAFTREEIVAQISVSPVAPQRFSAKFQYPDGQTANHIIAGDEIYIDAHILKWQPLANLFGLHTAYELDRVGGRYHDIEQERSAERSIHSLGKDRPVNLFDLRQRHTFLAVILDAKYGSATFVPVTQAAELELKISNTGLLMREVSPTTSLPVSR